MAVWVRGGGFARSIRGASRTIPGWFTAIAICCSDPRYRSAVCIDECPEQEFNLLKIATVLTAELGSGTAQFVRAEVFNSNCFDDCSTTDHMAQSPNSSRRIARLRDRPKQPAVLDLGRGHPGVDSLLHPDRHRHCSKTLQMVVRYTHLS
jgi:hypothetical protein